MKTNNHKLLKTNRNKLMKTNTVEPRSIVPATIVFTHVLFAIFGPE